MAEEIGRSRRLGTETNHRSKVTFPSLTVFFDGHCPLCTQEMQTLCALDHLRRLELIDIHGDVFKNYPQVDKEQASAILQAQQADGSMLYGLDANCRAWELVGRKRWLRVLRWPVIAFFADLGYLFFAKHRSKIAFIVTGKRSCSNCGLPELERRTNEKA